MLCGGHHPQVLQMWSKALSKIMPVLTQGEALAKAMLDDETMIQATPGCQIGIRGMSNESANLS